MVVKKVHSKDKGICIRSCLYGIHKEDRGEKAFYILILGLGYNTTLCCMHMAGGKHGGGNDL